jgi:16S rRNA (cytosine967-C5)-methyltransferase
MTLPPHPTAAPTPSLPSRALPNRWQFRACARVLAEVLTWQRPADGVLSAFFRQNPKLGSRDRTFVAETTYAIVRRLRFVRALCASPDPSPEEQLLAWLVHGVNLPAQALEAWLEPAEKKRLRALEGRLFVPQTPAEALDMPDWLAQCLLDEYGEQATQTLANALNTPADMDLRANITRMDRKTLALALAKEGIQTEPTPYSPWGLRLRAHPALSRHPLFESGAFEVQDEGSQLLALLLGARRGERVVDFCAGAGGKTLAIGAMMRSSGQIYALDVAEKRLQKLRKRITRAGLSNVQPWLLDSENDPRLAALRGKANRVLVDAPCSGLGTLRRNPDLKWRQNPTTLAQLQNRQTAILQAASTLVQEEGSLVYATCSLLKAENEDIISAFLAKNPQFHLEDARTRLTAQGIAINTGPFLALRPDLHGCDGFFAAFMTRRTTSPAPLPPN